MPSYKVGARGEGAVTALLDVVQSRRRRQEEQEDEVRKFRRRVQEVVLQRPDVSDEFVQAMLSGQPTEGVPIRRGAGAFDPLASGLQPASYRDPATGIEYKSPSDTRRSEFLDTSKIRQEFLNRPEVKEYVTINTNVRTMDTILREAQRTGKTNKVALDQALITMYNKLTDPNSVVRESEYARTPENLPFVNRLAGAVEKLRRGGAGLTDSDREALVWGAKVIANERGRTFNDALSDYTDLSQRYGMQQELVTRGLSPHQPYQFGSWDSGGQVPSFASEEEALAANLPVGTQVVINGRRAVIE